MIQTLSSLHIFYINQTKHTSDYNVFAWAALFLKIIEGRDRLQ